jgi:hypothetical protein
MPPVPVARRPLVVATPIALLALLSFTVLGQADALLAAMHQSGDGSFGMADLVRIFPRSHAPPSEVVDTWRQWEEAGGESATGPTALVHLYVLVDCLFALLYGALLTLLVGWLRERLDSEGWSGEVRRTLGWSFTGIAGAVAADLVENVAQWHIEATSGDHSWVAIGQVASAMKWLSLLLVLVPVVAALLDQGRHAARWGRQLVIARVHVLLLVVLAVALAGPEKVSGQAIDVVRRWGDRWSAALAPITLLTIALAAAMFGTSAWLIARSEMLRKQGPSLPGRAEDAAIKRGHAAALLVTFAVSGSLLLLIAARLGDPRGGWLAQLLAAIGGAQGLYAALAIVAIIGVLSAPVAGLSSTAPDSAAGPSRVPAALGGLVPALIGLVAWRTGVGDVLYADSGDGKGLMALGVVFLTAGFALFALCPLENTATDVKPRALLAITPAVVAVALGVGAVALFAPWWLSAAVGGTVGVTLLFALVAVAVGSVLVAFAELVPPPPAMSLLRLRRTPVLTLLLVWLVVASAVDGKGLHDVRTIDGRSVPDRPLGEQYATWRAEQPSGEAVPMVFVSAAGGGIRAAHWTALTLECVMDAVAPCDGGEPPDSDVLFAVSGVSGGSLGLVTFAALPPERPPGWASSSRLSDDFLAPTLARTLFVDLPNSLLRVHELNDRAAILERSWERAWPSGALERGLSTRAGAFPLLILNGTSVSDGCRFVTSTVRLAGELRDEAGNLIDSCLSLRRYEAEASDAHVGPTARDWSLSASKDLDPFLCDDRDVMLSTAVLLSARFPFVTPSGRLACRDRPAVHVVDGGYFENSGAASVVELYNALEPAIAEDNAAGPGCVVPVLIEIDNHYLGTERDVGARPKELLAPQQTYGAARSAREANAREAAALAFSGSLPGDKLARLGAADVDRVAHIHPRSHPGMEAPLGWTLSEAARRDLGGQLASAENGVELDKVRGWFGGDLRCAPDPD